MEEITRLEELVEGDQRAALSFGDAIRGDLDGPEALARWHRAMGNANRALSRLDTALDHYRAGIRLASRNGLTETHGLLLMSRAGAYSIMGDYKAARRDLDKAETLVEGKSLGRVRFQRAIVRQRFAEGSDSLADWNEVIPLLRDLDDVVFVAHALSNRGVVHTYRGDVSGADRDFLEALELYQQMHVPSGIAMTTHNLGISRIVASDLPGALSWFDDAAEQWAALGRPLGGMQVARARALLTAGLASDSLEQADASSRTLAESGLEADRVESLLVAAQASVVLGTGDAAHRAAEAANEFARQGRPGWRDTAQLLRLEALADVGEAGAREERAALRLARRLDAAGLIDRAHRAYLLAGLMALDRRGLVAAQNRLEKGKGARGSGLVENRLTYWALRSGLALASGEPVRALRGVERGIEQLELFRDAMAAPDARAGMAVHARRLVDVAHRAALASGEPAVLFRWLDVTADIYDQLTDSRLTSDTSPMSTPTTSGDDDKGKTDLVPLSALLEQLRAVVREQTDVEPDPRLARRRRRIESEIKALTRRHRADVSRSRVLATTFEDLSLNASAIAFAEIAGDIHRVCRHGGDRFHHANLGPADDLTALIRSVAALYRRVATRSGARSESRLDRAVHLLDRRLLEGLSLDDDPVLVLPRGALALVPWPALPTIADRPVSLVLGLRSRQTTRRDPTADDRTTVIVGPRLVDGRAEAKALVDALGPNTRVLIGTGATTSASLAALGDSRTVHFICHGSFRADNPLFSSLEMFDGPMTVYDIAALDGPVAESVVLSSCSGAEVSDRPERAFLGMSSAFLAAGIRSVVASVAPVPDSLETCRFMVAYYRARLAGSTVAEGLAQARAASMNDRERLLAGVFVAFGETDAPSPHAVAPVLPRESGSDRSPEPASSPLNAGSQSGSHNPRS